MMMEQVDAREVQLGDVKFTIGKLLPMEGFKVFEMIRPGLKDALGVDDGDGEATANPIKTVLNIACAAEPEMVEKVRSAMFRHVRFTSPDVPTPTVLLSNEDTAFKDLEPYHIYEILVRTLTVNFTGSFSALMSRNQAEASDILP